MIGQGNLGAARGLQHIIPSPRGDFRLSFPPPVIDGLDRKLSCPGKTGTTPKGVENVINYVHGPTISEFQIYTQEPNYPKCVSASDHAFWHNIRMSDSAFDRDAVRAKMKELGFNQSDVAKVVGLPSQSAMSNILKGTRKVTVQEATIIYRFLGLNLATTSDLQHVPIIGFTSAGNWREAIEVPMGIMTIPPKKAGPKAFAVQVEGDSMNEVIEPGSYIVVDPDQKELQAGKCYLLQNGEHEVTVKCYRRDPARFVPMSSNPAHKEFLVSDRDVLILGRVVWKGGPM